MRLLFILIRFDIKLGFFLQQEIYDVNNELVPKENIEKEQSDDI